MPYALNMEFIVCSEVCFIHHGSYSRLRDEAVTETIPNTEQLDHFSAKV